MTNKINKAIGAIEIIAGEWLDAVFYRKYQLLYHKFENMLIFWPGNLAQESRIIRKLFIF
mgnify:CR=1 FL=1